MVELCAASRQGSQQVKAADTVFIRVERERRQLRQGDFTLLCRDLRTIHHLVEESTGRSSTSAGEPVSS